MVAEGIPPVQQHLQKLTSRLGGGTVEVTSFARFAIGEEADQ